MLFPGVFYVMFSTIAYASQVPAAVNVESVHQDYRGECQKQWSQPSLCLAVYLFVSGILPLARCQVESLSAGSSAQKRQCASPRLV